MQLSLTFLCPRVSYKAREYNGEEAASSSVLLLPSTAITNYKWEDTQPTLPLEEAFSPIMECGCYRIG
ncbi:jg3415 [Pararge aegeria aegeria]|uniref:Jg3415 protein n=1 Tax=Pararge aegeria aegeria TaxID=348720 RepID=A0A8S4RQH8_9NEOP|nr:jg3415 [Pararge aegeria aegeria]